MKIKWSLTIVIYGNDTKKDNQVLITKHKIQHNYTVQYIYSHHN